MIAECLGGHSEYCLLLLAVLERSCLGGILPQKLLLNNRNINIIFFLSNSCETRCKCRTEFKVSIFGDIWDKFWGHMGQFLGTYGT